MRILIALLLVIFVTCGNAAKTVVKPTVTTSYILLNLDTNTVVDSLNESEVRSIASITKLMSVLVVLRNDLNLDDMLTVVGKESSRYIRAGMKITRRHLIELALISSDNLAARTLAETFPGGYGNFVAAMNSVATDLEMNSTKYEDSTGLLAENRSSAEDIRKLILEIERWSIYRVAANAKSIIFSAVGIRKPVTISGTNTNSYVGKLEILAAKTGFTSSAGRCLTMLFMYNNTKYYLIVMGAKSAEQRRKIVDQLLDKIR